jgi:hypothetical protein
MTTSRENAGRVLYGGPAVPKPAAQAKQTPRPGKSLYSTEGYGGALASYYGRRNAKLRDDTEGLENSRLEEKQAEAFARRRGIAPADLQEVLAVVNEHEAFPKSAQVIAKRWEQAFEQLRLECGGREHAQRVLDGYVNVTKDLVKEVPTLADRAGLTGAANDVRVIKALARYGEQTSTTEEK